MYWEKQKNQTFQGLLDAGSELILILGPPNTTVASRAGACGDGVINGISSQVCLTVPPMGSRIHSVVISPDPEYSYRVA